jgi:MFS family permease
MTVLMTGVQVTKRHFLTILILFVSFFSWYFSFALSVLPRIVGSSTETFNLITSSFNFLIAFASLLSIFFIAKFNKVRIIYGYAITTSIASILLLVTSNSAIRLVILMVMGIFFGVGQIAFFTYFWSLTKSVERGRVAGLAGFIALPCAYIIGLIAETADFSGAVLLGFTISLATLAIRLLESEKKEIPKNMNNEEGFRPEKRTIILYSLPWIVFSLINATIARNISADVSLLVPSSLFAFLFLLQMASSGFGALVGGTIADLFGRRLSLGLCLTLYGISTVLGGLLQSYEFVYFMYAASGLTWGILWTVYGTVVWGDLADKESCAKRYAFGLGIFYSASGLGFLFTSAIANIPLIASALVGCFLIFLSNLPLVLAPELLSADFREKIKLRLHIKAVKKIRRSQNQG